ncbi:MAG: addiction module protein [Nitrospirae bacterium]|nr:addiction module protein [Nitrospirota bacterium]
MVFLTGYGRLVAVIRVPERRRTLHLKDLPEITHLSTPEKILLVEELWDSIAVDESSAPVLQSHLEELNKRLKKYEAAPGNLLSLEELQSSIESRK